MGWLNAIPRNSKGQRQQPRAKAYKSFEDLPLPKVSQGYMVALFSRCGPAMVNGVGEAPLSAVELLAWQHGTRTSLRPCEFEMLLDMSRAYCAGKAGGEDVNAPSPVVVRIDPKKAAANIKAALRGKA